MEKTTLSAFMNVKMNSTITYNYNTLKFFKIEKKMMLLHTK